MKIAVASSGLGHVARGIETWARDTAVALVGAGCDVTLFAGGEVSGLAAPTVRVLPCLRRFEARTLRIARWLPGAAWRWGFKDGYGLEQFTFWWRLKEELRRGGFDILHVQDPLLAAWCRRWRVRGWLRTQEILAHGTEEPLDFLAQFPCVQHLAPWHLEEARKTVTGKPHWTAIPNFVDTEVFAPAPDGATRAACRAKFGIRAAVRVIGCVAAVKNEHKRIDYLIREFARYAHTEAGREARLIIAGARQPDSDALVALARELAPEHIQVLFDLTRADMPALYRALDVFVLTSLFEMMPIALLEAVASGVPALVHRHPVLEWIVGAGGAAIDMAEDGALAVALAGLKPDWREGAAIAARRQAETQFSRRAVIGQYMTYYERVAS